MTEPTPRLALPLLEPGQAQKEAFHNESQAVLDLAVHAAASGPIDMPPPLPLQGQCWIVGATPTGEWTSHAHNLAGWTQGGWRFVGPYEGMCVWLGRTRGHAVFSGGEWRIGEAYGKLFVEGQQVVGLRSAAIPEPAGGLVVDGEARAAIVALLEALRAHGLIETD